MGKTRKLNVTVPITHGKYPADGSNCMCCKELITTEMYMYHAGHFDTSPIPNTNLCEPCFKKLGLGKAEWKPKAV